MARIVRMSTDEAWAVLADAHTGVLTSLRRDGWPISLPVWFVVRDRRIYVAGPDHTKKFSRIRNDPRVSFLVEAGTRWAELIGVQLTGRAAIMGHGPHRDSVMAALHAKYAGFRTPRAEMPSATRARYEAETSTIEIVPEGRLISWDNRRLVADGTR